jgi:hypothetical protein
MRRLATHKIEHDELPELQPGKDGTAAEPDGSADLGHVGAPSTAPSQWAIARKW